MDAARFYDVAVIGGGPAGLTAALYLARARYRVLVLEKETFGGQITITEEVVNYPGVIQTTGRALTDTMRRQAEGFGAEFCLATVTGLEADGDIRTVHTDKGDFTCFGILIATGAHPRRIGFPGEDDFRGRGVAYCATCDGEFFAGKPVFVVGGGFAAAEESVFLTRYASHVTVLIRGADFTCAAAAAQPAREHPGITVLTHTEVVSVTGDSVPRVLRCRNTETGEETAFAPEEGFGVFIFAGYEPETALVRELVDTDPQGYILTDDARRTSRAGIYAAGDVCRKNLRQVVTAVGDGATAATELEKYAAAMQEKTGLHPRKPEAVPADREVKAESAPEAGGAGQGNGLFPPEMLAQLRTVFGRMASPLTLELHPDGGAVTAELRSYLNALASLTDKLTVTEAAGDGAYLPCVRILRDGVYTGLSFHGVPGGHEFTSFVLGLYNAAGPGQPLEDSLRARIAAINRPVRMQVLVSLSCSMCPELVTAAQHIAALNPQVCTEVYDIRLYPALKERYNVMSVPCLVLDDGQVIFGRRTLDALLTLLGV